MQTQILHDIIGTGPILEKPKIFGLCLQEHIITPTSVLKPKYYKLQMHTIVYITVIWSKLLATMIASIPCLCPGKNLLQAISLHQEQKLSSIEYPHFEQSAALSYFLF